MNVKILRDYDVCFDGVKKTCLEKGRDFDCPDEHLHVLVDSGVVLDPNMEKKDAENKALDIMETKELEADERSETRANSKAARFKRKVKEAARVEVAKQVKDIKDENAVLLEELETAEEAGKELEQAKKGIEEFVKARDEFNVMKAAFEKDADEEFLNQVEINAELTETVKELEVELLKNLSVEEADEKFKAAVATLVEEKKAFDELKESKEKNFLTLKDVNAELTEKLEAVEVGAKECGDKLEEQEKANAALVEASQKKIADLEKRLAKAKKK